MFQSILDEWDLVTWVGLIKPSGQECLRMIENNESLCARILRAKYYLDSNILSVKFTKGYSYVWQSICSGTETLNQGYIWRIGNGLNVNIWDDPWIPT